MRFVDNDRWGGAASRSPGNTRYLYTIEAWRDLFESWRVEVRRSTMPASTSASS